MSGSLLHPAASRVDQPMGRTSRVSRASDALEVVPTTTSAWQMLDVVLPHLAGRIIRLGGAWWRWASVSCVDLCRHSPQNDHGPRRAGLFRKRPGRLVGYHRSGSGLDRPGARTESFDRARPEIKRAKGGIACESFGGMTMVGLFMQDAVSGPQDGRDAIGRFGNLECVRAGFRRRRVGSGPTAGKPLDVDEHGDRRRLSAPWPPVGEA